MLELHQLIPVVLSYNQLGSFFLNGWWWVWSGSRKPPAGGTARGPSSRAMETAWVLGRPTGITPKWQPSARVITTSERVNGTEIWNRFCNDRVRVPHAYVYANMCMCINIYLCICMYIFRWCISKAVECSWRCSRRKIGGKISETQKGNLHAILI